MKLVCGPPDDLKSVEVVVPHGRRIAFLLSGGADSAILLYMACLELLATKRNPVDEFQHILTIPKGTDGPHLHSFKIVNWINDRLNIRLNEPLIAAPADIEETHHADVIARSIVYYRNELNLNYSFLADQQAVPLPDIVQGLYPVRPSVNPYPDYFHMPFLNVNKSHTIDLHYRLGTEQLLQISHSCTEKRIGRCLQCYHCNERKWAFEKLQKIDPGEN